MKVLALKEAGTRGLTPCNVGLGRRDPFLLVMGKYIGHGNTSVASEARSQRSDIIETLAEPATDHG
jgi:hypothetical protein